MQKLLVLLLLLGAALAGAAYWLTQPASTLDPNGYTVLSVEYGRAAEIVSATGLVQARDVFPVGTELGGKVVEVLADFNQIVREGDVLLRLDDRVARQKLKQAEVAVEVARAAVRQAEATRDAAATAVQRVREQSPEVRRQNDVDVVEAHLRAAEVGIEVARVRVQEAEEARRQAELGLKMHAVRAPVLGPDPAGASAKLPGRVGSLAGDERDKQERRAFTVLDRRVALNQQVGPPAAAQLFTLASEMEHMQVHVPVVEGDVHKIVRGQEADFTVPGGDGDVAFRGRVEEVRLTPTSEHGAVFYKAIVNVRNERDPATSDWRLRPGLTASVEFVRRVHPAAWKLPSAALSFQPDPATLTEAAVARLTQLPDERWKAVWVLGADHKPWPLFVRLGGGDARGEAGIQDLQACEVLEWDPTLQPPPDPKDQATYPQVILAGPAVKKSSLFNAPNIKF